MAKKYDKEIELIIRDLNQRTGRSYKTSTPKTRSFITARLKEGYTVSDFMLVHRYKVKEWKDTERDIYVRPNTLYNPSNFEDYLENAKQKLPKPRVKVTPKVEEVDDSPPVDIRVMKFTRMLVHEYKKGRMLEDDYKAIMNIDIVIFREKAFEWAKRHGIENTGSRNQELHSFVKTAFSRKVKNANPKTKVPTTED